MLRAKSDLILYNNKFYKKETVLSVHSYGTTAIYTTTNLQIRNIVLESNYLDLVKACKREPFPWKISPIVDEIKQIENHFESIEYAWTGRV